MTTFSYPAIRQQKLKILAVAIMGVSLQVVSGQTLAQASRDEIAELRAQILALSSRLEELESKNEEVSETVEETRAAVSSSAWISNIEISGDLRTRYERHDDSSKEKARNRSRIRSRLDISAQVKDDWNVSFGLAGGGDDPISTNQTLGGGATTKDFRLDYAYFEYHGFDNMMITGGKTKNVFFKPGGNFMIYDSDYRPEGLGLKFARDDFFVNAATYFIESDDKAGTQDVAMMWGLQAGYKMPVGDDASLTLGGSYYDTEVKGSEPFYDNDSYRNSLDASGRLMYNYHDTELFAQYDTRLGDQPLRVFGDIVKNQDGGAYDTGWTAGVKLGNVSGKGTWELGYTWEDLEADAVYGAFSDSDFGASGTDSRDHVLDAVYGIGDNTEVGVTYFINEYGKATRGEWVDFDRLHVWVTVDF